MAKINLETTSDAHVEAARVQQQIKDYLGLRSSDLMFEYTLLDGNMLVLDTGKYVVIWKNDSTSWQLYRDIWTTSAPLPTA